MLKLFIIFHKLMGHFNFRSHILERSFIGPSAYEVHRGLGELGNLYPPITYPVPLLDSMVSLFFPEAKIMVMWGDESLPPQVGNCRQIRYFVG